jgi:hypothetical protein
VASGSDNIIISLGIFCIIGFVIKFRYFDIMIMIRRRFENTVLIISNRHVTYYMDTLEALFIRRYNTGIYCRDHCLWQ